MKKLFGGINLTWKKLIIFAVLSAVYTVLMILIPVTKDTSFRDISVYFEWWVLFGIIIISNSKSHLDSGLKCIVFFLISQPLIYLLQVPFNSMGFGLFRYYKYWFILTLFTFPMGFIGYFIKKKNVLSMIILLPMLILLAYQGIGYFAQMMEKFPYHILSFIVCFLFIIIIIMNLLDKKGLRITAFSIVAVVTLGFALYTGGIVNGKYETFKNLDSYDITLEGETYISYFSGTEQGEVEIIETAPDVHSIIIRGRKSGKYEFTISDDNNHEYTFEYYYDEETKSVEVNMIE